MDQEKNNKNRGLPINPVDGATSATQSSLDDQQIPPANDSTAPPVDEGVKPPLNPTNSEDISGDVLETQKVVDLDTSKFEEKMISSSSQSGAVNKVGDDPGRAPAMGEISTFDEKDKVSEEGAKVLKEQAKAKSLESDDELLNVNSGGGINLIPKKSKAEVKKEKRTTGINLFSAFAILVLVFFSVVILGVNAGMKIWLNREEAVLKDLENDLLAESEIIRANEEILQRFNLYQDVQQATFSPKEVLIYWRELVSDFGRLDSVELEGGLTFDVSGESNDLKQLSFLWHLLTIDDKVDRTNLKSFSNREEGSTFTFEGDLNFDYFAQKDQNLTTEIVEDVSEQENEGEEE